MSKLVFTQDGFKPAAKVAKPQAGIKPKETSQKKEIKPPPKKS